MACLRKRISDKLKIMRMGECDISYAQEKKVREDNESERQKIFIIVYER